MKVIVISCHPLQDNRVSKMINTVIRNGHSVVYINSSTQQECADNWFDKTKIIQYDVDFRKENAIKCLMILMKISKIIKKEHPDIVHVHDPYMIPVFKAARKIGAKTVYDKHEAFEVIGGISGKSGKILEIIYKKYIDGIVYVSRAQESYLEQCGYKNKAYIPNYQSKKLFDSIVVEKAGGIKLFYAGDLSDETRNTSLMLKLINKILGEFSNVSCVVAGKTNDLEIVQLIKELNSYGERFKYVPYMLYSDVIKNTKESDIGLYFTKYDLNNIGSSPNKINEYLLAGIAVFSQGRYADWEIIDGNAGRVYSYNASFDDMYEGIKEMIVNPILLKSMKNNSKELGEQRTWEIVESEYENLYEQIVGKSNE